MLSIEKYFGAAMQVNTRRMPSKNHFANLLQYEKIRSDQSADKLGEMLNVFIELPKT